MNDLDSRLSYPSTRQYSLLWGEYTTDCETVYNDRMLMWEPDRYHQAIIAAGMVGDIPETARQAQDFLRHYYGDFSIKLVYVIGIRDYTVIYLYGCTRNGAEEE